MPLPNPAGEESRDEFIGRCMSDATMQEYDQDQRMAICSAQWDKKEVEPEEPEEEPEVELEKPAEKKDEDRTMTFIMTDEQVDRDGDIVKLDGADMESFEQNPVFLLWHEKKAFPIGKVLNSWVEGSMRKCKVKFLPEGKSDTADLAYYMFKEGFLNSVSIGFRPSPPIEDNVQQNEFGGLTFNKYEIFELSGVTVPGNPRALAERKDYEKEFEGAVFKTYGLTPAKPKEAKAESEEAKLSKLRDMLKDLNSIYKEK